MVVDKQDVHDSLGGRQVVLVGRQMNRTRSRVRLELNATKMPAFSESIGKPEVWEQRLQRAVARRCIAGSPFDNLFPV
jgi:hypothetical protein